MISLFSFCSFFYSFNLSFLDCLPVNLVEGQYAFVNQTDAFDANLTIANEYCASINANTTGPESIVAPLINALESSYHEAQEISLAVATSPTSDISNNCITYGNVVFLPTIANQDNHQQNPSKLEHDVANRTYTFLQAPHIDGNASTVLCEPSAFNEIHESHSNLSAGSTQIDRPPPMYQIVDSNNVNIEIQHDAGQQQEVLLQDENGQLYRTVQNIFVDGTSMCTNELLPIADQMQLQTMQNTYQQNNQPAAPYEIPVNFISTSNSNERTSDTIDANAELQQVQFIFDSLGNSGAINDINQSNAVDTNQYQPIEANAAQPNYTSQFEMQSNKEQQNLLESTMSTLCKCGFFPSFFFYFGNKKNNFSSLQWLP